MINEGGIIGSGEGLVNQNSREFKELQRMIKERSVGMKESEWIANQLFSIRFQMESYLDTAQPEQLKGAGRFLEEFIAVLKIKKKAFAEYIDYKESNLSAIFSGKRKINTDLAIKFGEIFNVDPVIWLHIQNKNELIETLKENKSKYEKYKLKDLLREVN